VLQTHISKPKTLLILGVARSGSTWVSRILSSGYDKVAYHHEPDSHFLYAAAAHAKCGLGIYPVCTDHLPESLEKLWANVFHAHSRAATRSGKVQQKAWNWIPGIWKDYSVGIGDTTLRGSVARQLSRGATLAALRNQHMNPEESPADSMISRKTPDCILAKSVHSPFYAQQLVQAIKPDAVVVTIRPLEELAASWISLNYWPVSKDQQPQTIAKLSERTQLQQMAWPENEIKSIVWSIAAMQLELIHAAEESNWILFDHASACESPAMRFKELFSSLQISWTEQTEADLAITDKPGKSSYDTYRVSAAEIGKWKSRLAPEVVDDIAAALQEIGLPPTRPAGKAAPASKRDFE